MWETVCFRVKPQKLQSQHNVQSRFSPKQKPLPFSDDNEDLGNYPMFIDTLDLRYQLS